MGMQRLATFMPLGLCLGLLLPARAANPNPPKFLIVSAPRDSKVSYTRIHSRSRGQAPEAGQEMRVLIDTGLVHPQGLAVEQKSRRLLIADPDSKAIFAYDLRARQDTLTVGPKKVLANDTEARWVAVDGLGNIFFSDEPKNQILKLSRAKSLRGDSKPEVIFDGASLTQVSAPGGVASDGFHAFWVNKQIGMQVGSVVQGGSTAEKSNFASGVQPIAKNVDKSYGICLALSNVFFTQPESTISAVKKGGSTVVPISDKLTNPRGCAWDGDGTIYVADRGANAVFSFAGNMPTLSTAQVTKAVDFQDAFGVAVYSAAAERLGRAAALVAAVCLAAFAAPTGP